MCPKKGEPVLVAAHRDLRRIRPRQGILVEHGSGQTYGDSNPAYSGGADRDSAVMFLCPSEQVAERNRARYPDIPAPVVGCPLLDRWHPRYEVADPIVAVAWHWSCKVWPESRSAFRHMAPALPLLKERFEIIGTAHPRMIRTVEPTYRALGIEMVGASEVMDRAKVLVVDNSSLAFEFASTGRAVVWMNAPWYRRDVEHGLRFWEAAEMGLQADEPEELPELVEKALHDDGLGDIREKWSGRVYAFRDGRCAERAAEAVTELYDWT